MKENGVSGLPSFVLSWSMQLWPPCRFRLCCPSCIVRWRTDSEILPGSFPRNLVVNWGFFDTFWKWSWGWGMANDPTLPVVFLSSLMSFWQNHISTNWITIKFSLVIMLFSLMTNSLGITPLPLWVSSKPASLTQEPSLESEKFWILCLSLRSPRDSEKLYPGLHSVQPHHFANFTLMVLLCVGVAVENIAQFSFTLCTPSIPTTQEMQPQPEQVGERRWNAFPFVSSSRFSHFPPSLHWPKMVTSPLFSLSSQHPLLIGIFFS